MAFTGSGNCPRDFVEDVRRRIESVSIESDKDCETLLREHEEYIHGLAAFIGQLEGQKTLEIIRRSSLYSDVIQKRQAQHAMQEKALRHQLVALAEEKTAAIAELEEEQSYTWEQQLEAAVIELEEKDRWQKNRAQRVADYVLGGAERLDSFTADAESILSTALDMHTLLRTRKTSSVSSDWRSRADKIWTSNNIAAMKYLQMEEDQSNVLKQSVASDEDAKRAKDAAMNESLSNEQASNLELQRKVQILDGEFEKRRLNFEQEIAQLKQAKEDIVEKLEARKAAISQDVTSAYSNTVFQLRALMGHLECTAKCLRSFSGIAPLQTVSNLAKAIFEAVKSTENPSVDPSVPFPPSLKPTFNTTATKPASNWTPPTPESTIPSGTQPLKFTFPTGSTPMPASEWIGTGSRGKGGVGFKAMEKESEGELREEGMKRTQEDEHARRKTADARAGAAAEREQQRERRRERLIHEQQQRERLTSTPKVTPEQPPRSEGWWRNFQFQWSFLASQANPFKLPLQGFLDIPWPIVPPTGTTSLKSGNITSAELLDLITELNVNNFIVQSARLSGQTQRTRVLKELARYHPDKRSWLAVVQDDEKELVEQGCEIVVRILNTLKGKCPSA